MATLTTSSNPGQADIFLSEAQGQRSRDNVIVTMVATVALPSGSLLTKSGTKYVKYAGGATACDAVLLTKLPAQAAGDAKAVAFVRDCEVREGGLVSSDANAVTKLALSGVIIRSSPGLAVTY